MIRLSAQDPECTPREASLPPAGHQEAPIRPTWCRPGLGASPCGGQQRLRLGSGSWCPGRMPFGDAVSRALSASPSSPFPGRPQARKAWESERLWWERWPPRRRGPTPACEGGSCSPRRPWGAAEGTATGAGAPPGGK